MTHLRTFVHRARTFAAHPLGAALLLFVAVAVLFGPLWGLCASSLPIVIGATPVTDSDIVRHLASWGILDASGGVRKLNIVAKTANYQLLSPVTNGGDASGTVFTNRGAGGAVTFTLPAITAGMVGTYYDFVGFANQTFTVAGAATTVATFNNAAATSVACSTAGAKIGAHIRAICDGTSWFLIGDTVGGTYTVA